MATWHAVLTASFGAAGLAATAFATGLLVSAGAVTRTAIATSSRSAGTTCVLAATRLVRLPAVVAWVWFSAFTVSVATASAATAPNMITLLRTIDPPFGVVAG